MDLTITNRWGWALVRDVRTDQTAVCIPTVTEEVMAFTVVERCDDYDTAMTIVAALHGSGYTVNDFIEKGTGSEQEEAEGAQPVAPQIEVTPAAHVGGGDA